MAIRVSMQCYEKGFIATMKKQPFICQDTKRSFTQMINDFVHCKNKLKIFFDIKKFQT